MKRKASNQTWRDKARREIQKVVAAYGTTDLELLEKRIRQAYPFGPREYYPYRVWLEEVQRTMHNARQLRGELPRHEDSYEDLPLFANGGGHE